MKKWLVFLLVTAVLLNCCVRSIRKNREKKWTVYLLVIAALLGYCLQSLREKPDAEGSAGNG